MFPNNENLVYLSLSHNVDKNKIFIDYRFKIVYCIAMLSVIASHCLGKGSIELNIQGWFPYRSFHMPLFMFASGYFFKRKNLENVLEYIKRKFKRLIVPIYIYNFFYGIYSQVLKKWFNKNNIKKFNYNNILIKPLGGRGFRYILPSWFSSSLFFVELYNILKRKAISSLRIEIHEFIYFIIDFILAYYCITLSNKGFNTSYPLIDILRFVHLNIYYQLGIFYKKNLEYSIENIRNDIYFIIIFAIKLCYHLYYSKEPSFYYGMSEYYNYTPFTVIIISVSGIAFWIRVSKILVPSIGKSFYVNTIADNTFSIMINHLLAIELVLNVFAILSKNTKYFNDFDFHKFFLLKGVYIYLPNNILQSGIIYFLSCLVLPILIQKIINKFKSKIFK